MSGKGSITRREAAATLALLPLGAAAAPGSAPVALEYLLPAPREAIVFAPFVLAEAAGRYDRAGLSVTFRSIAGGGVAVGRTLAKGEGSLGGAVGDTALLLRAEGVAVRGVALLGQHSFLTLMTRTGTSLDATSLRGLGIGVPSRRDTSFYAAEALLRSRGLAPADAPVRDAPSAELIAALGRGELGAVIGTVDWGVNAERAGVGLDYRPLDPFYPALAQAVLAADTTIRERPAAVRAFVRATLAEIRELVRDPDAAARRYEVEVPASGFSQAEIARVLRLLGRHVYGAAPGPFDPARLSAAGRAAAAQGLVPASSRSADSFTNAFIS